jgi:hypothetical protein
MWKRLATILKAIAAAIGIIEAAKQPPTPPK